MPELLKFGVAISVVVVTVVIIHIITQVYYKEDYFDDGTEESD